MKETVHFTKMQGAGNDYIYVDTEQYNIPDPEKAAIAWSAYHTGIGSDGLVLIGKPHDGERECVGACRRGDLSASLREMCQGVGTLDHHGFLQQVAQCALLPERLPAQRNPEETLGF